MNNDIFRICGPSLRTTQIALYFVFLSHYTSWLGYLSAGGLVTGLSILIITGVKKSFPLALNDNPFIPFFNIFVGIWSQLMIEYWKRTEVTKAVRNQSFDMFRSYWLLSVCSCCSLQLEWGMSDYEQEERERPEFTAELVDSVVNGEREKYFPPDVKFKLQIISVGIITPAIIFVIGVVSIIFYIQVVITEDVKNPADQGNYSLLTSIANALQIQILNYLYTSLAVGLTQKENHR
jgi:hypothetical protein